MKLAHSFSLLLLIAILIAACKKEVIEDPTIEEPSTTPLNIAPCELEEQLYLNDSISTHSAFNFYPEATYTVTFYDSANTALPYHKLEFSFLNYPETGMYYLVYEFDTAQSAHVNQIALASIYGSDIYRSIDSYLPFIYVEKNDQELIISYCEVPYEFHEYNPNTDCYEGYGFGFRKYRKSF